MTTPATPADLITWLRAQLDDDEQRAQWRIEDHTQFGQSELDPYQVRAEVDAKRRILDLHAVQVERVDAPAFNPVTGERISDEYDVTCAVCGWASGDPTSACATVRLLALPYADRPGYREEWKPA